MLKRSIDKTTFDALPDIIKTEYKGEGDKYTLDLDGGDELLRAKEHEASERKKREKELEAAKAELATINAKIAAKELDVAGVEKMYKDKIESMEKASKDADSAYKTRFAQTLVASEAEKIARDISRSPSLLSRVIADRLSVDFVDGEPLLRVKSADGKPSVMTAKELATEIAENPEYEPIIIKRAGSDNKKETTPRYVPAAGDKPLDISKMSPKELAAHMAAKSPYKGE